jgi:thioredoxin-like negative regulator of GroEL
MKAFADAEKRYPAEPEVKFAFANFLKEIGATDRALSKLNQIQDKNPEIQKRVQELSNQIKVTQQNEKPKSG